MRSPRIGEGWGAGGTITEYPNNGPTLHISDRMRDSTDCLTGRAMVNRYQNLPYENPDGFCVGDLPRLSSISTYSRREHLSSLCSESVMADATRGYKHTRPAKIVVCKH